MWADDLGSACEQTYLNRVASHPAWAWIQDRGVPAMPGIGLGTLPELDYPPRFSNWAARVGWSDGVVLVIRDWLGRVVGFQHRRVDEKSYMTFPVYDIHLCPLLWGADAALERAWQTNHLILVEGVFDAAAVRLAGGDNVIATLMARPSQAAMRWVQRLARRVTVLYDMDEAGRKGCQTVRQQLPDRIVSTPEYASHDPWDLWASRPQALRAIVGS